jgi:hypothetical protein
MSGPLRTRQGDEPHHDARQSFDHVALCPAVLHLAKPRQARPVDPALVRSPEPAQKAAITRKVTGVNAEVVVAAADALDDRMPGMGPRLIEPFSDHASVVSAALVVRDRLPGVCAAPAEPCTGSARAA